MTLLEISCLVSNLTAKEAVEILGDCLRIWDAAMTGDQRLHSCYAMLVGKAIGIPLDSAAGRVKRMSEETCISILETERNRKTARRGKRRKVEAKQS